MYNSHSKILQLEEKYKLIAMIYYYIIMHLSLVLLHTNPLSHHKPPYSKINNRF